MSGCNAGRRYIPGMPQVVPTDFVGMSFRGWPLFNQSFWANAGQPYPTSTPPTPDGLRWGSTRILDTGYSFWAQIESAAGVYNWTNLDAIVTAYKQSGRTTYYNVFGTPLVYVSDSTDSGRVDLYQTPAGGAYPGSTSPNGLTGVANFVTALINRYNKAGGAWFDANGGTLGKGIQAIECWNEPFFQGYPGFWWGTAGQLIDLCWTIYSAVKAADSTVLVSTPGCPTGDTLRTFLTSAGTIYTSKTGADCCDLVSVHNYKVNLPGTEFDNWQFDFITGIPSNPGAVGVASWRASMAAGGVSNKPLWMNEGGYDYDENSTAVAIIAAQSPEWRFEFWARTMMLGAAYGFKKWTSYCWDAPYCSNMMYDPNGGQRAVNLMHDSVAGRTITSASYISGGAVELTFDSGPPLKV